LRLALRQCASILAHQRLALSPLPTSTVQHASCGSGFGWARAY
jgi:hypothetical protein